MPFLTLDQLPALEVRWLWPGRLASGHLAILDGDPGLGKSLLSLDLCARITTGRPFPDGSPGGEPASVIVLNAEDGARDTVHGRLRAAGADLARVQVYERIPGEEFLRLPGQLHRLEDAIAASCARYVVLDPIMSFLDAKVNPASDHSVRAALAPLADLAQTHGCAIQLIRHLNKSSGTNALYRGLCSIGFIASCRGAWLVARDPYRGKQFVLTQPKNNLDPPQVSLAYAIETAASTAAHIVWKGVSTFDDHDVLVGTPQRFHMRRRAQEFLLNFLKDGPRPTCEIWAAAQAHRFSRATLDRARVSLDITSTRVHGGKREQANYWVLPTQKFTAAICDLPELAEQLRKQQHARPRLTPLDDVEPRPA